MSCFVSVDSNSFITGERRRDEETEEARGEEREEERAGGTGCSIKRSSCPKKNRSIETNECVTG